MKGSKLLSSAALLAALFGAGSVMAAESAKTPQAASAAKEDGKKGGAKAKAKGAKAPEAAKTKEAEPKGTVVEMKTSEGTIKIELADKEAPVTVKNFIGYVNDKFYDGTLFHRVIDGFMIQGGGFTSEGEKLTEKQTKASIVNEAKNGLKNDRGSIAMARTGDPNSATAQFFINHVNNDRLNYPQPDGHGYAVFGKVVEGLDVVDKIAKVKTGSRSGMSDVPSTDVKIISAQVVKSNVN